MFRGEDRIASQSSQEAHFSRELRDGDREDHLRLRRLRSEVPTPGNQDVQ